LPFIASEFLPAGGQVSTPPAGLPRLAITLSRQSGSGAHIVADRLVDLLRGHTADPARPWIVFDRNLAEKVLEDHNLPRRFARFMPEDRIAELADTIDDLLGLHPPSSTLIEQTAETIRQLAEQGNVILIGRGANLITSGLDHVFHVRLTGSLEKRAEHVRETQGLSPKAALEQIQREDRGRERYLKKYFGREPADPLLYHLVVNTDLVSYENAARLIADAALSRMRERKVARATALPSPSA
jgi:cytidylate kinase